MSVCCAFCGEVGQVLDTRRNNGTITRRRYCSECDFRWTTAEGEDAEKLRRENARLRSIIVNIRAALAGASVDLPGVQEGRTSGKNGA